MKHVLYLSFCILILFTCSLRAETNEISDNGSIKEYTIQVGNIVDSIILEDAIIRYIKDQNADEDSDYSGYVAQGHIKNITKKTLVEVKIDVSFYDKSMKFLGLDELSFLDFDEIGPGMTMPFSIDLDIPEGTAFCKINIVARKEGLIDKIL